jgi:DNA mismatch repair protein MutS2
VNSNTFRTLEFGQIRALLLQHTGSVSGRRRIQGLVPLTEVAAVREALSLTSEGVRVFQALGRQPYHDLPDVTAILPAARVQGQHLEPIALSDVASFIEGAVEIARRVARHEGAVRLAHRASLVRDTTEVAVAIRRAILPGGEVADDASPKLAETRRALARLRARLTSVMEAFLQGKDADRVLQDKLITTRNDRYVVLLKAEHRGQIPGIVHGSSGSGASVFVEPLPAVDLNNDIVELQDEERREIVLILRALTVRVGDRAPDIADAAETMGELDAVQAMAMLARDMGAAPPEIAEDLRLDLVDARHPLLMPRLAERLGTTRTSRREPVPVSIRVGFGEPVLVISGPNTGGKTVALKTAGLLAMMAQCGLHIPAAEGSLLPVFRSLYADIGDEQSIAANLSTFSAHLAAIVEMTHDLAEPALVLLDEVGAGTDPTEGGALGVAIVEHFRTRGAMVVATTHHGLMKAYAQSTPGVACASFGYDPTTYEPTYRLALGVPGRSLALEMAERLGLPAAVVADARSRRDEKQAQAEDLLARLEKDQAELEEARSRLADEQLELNAARARVEILEREAKAKKRTEAEGFARELRRRTEEAAKKAADAIRVAVERVETTRRSAAAEGTKARTEAVLAIREAHDEALRGSEVELPALAEEATELPIAVGSRVRLKSLAVTGEVTALHEQGGVEVAVSGKRFLVPRTELVALERGSLREAATRPAPLRARSGDGEAAQVNLVGLRVDEAMPRVDKALDDAALADRQQVRVVHGFGEGKLRRAVAELLEGHPHVASWRSGAANEGGGGVTIVELKD